MRVYDVKYIDETKQSFNELVVNKTVNSENQRRLPIYLGYCYVMVFTTFKYSLCSVRIDRDQP